jgi:hypothetical protein
MPKRSNRPCMLVRVHGGGVGVNVRRACPNPHAHACVCDLLLMSDEHRSRNSCPS